MIGLNDMPRKAEIILALLDAPIVQASALRAFIETRDAGDGADACIAAAMSAARDEIVGLLVPPSSTGGASA